MKKLQVGVLLILLSLIFTVSAESPNTWSPGVAVGDYFTYEMYGVFTSNRSNISLVIPQFEFNNTAWVKINIAKVEGSMIYQVYTLHFNNESESSFSISTDVDPTYTSHSAFGQAVPICAANIGIGDLIPTAGLTINDTAPKAYGSGQRETNHAQWNTSDDWGNGYFDCKTGVMVDFVRTHRFVNNGTGEIVEKTDVIKLIDTNRWEVNLPFPSTLFYYIAGTVIVIAVVSAALLVYRKFELPKRRNLQHSLR